jgi:hypothetical protein
MCPFGQITYFMALAFLQSWPGDLRGNKKSQIRPPVTTRPVGSSPMDHHSLNTIWGTCVRSTAQHWCMQHGMAVYSCCSALPLKTSSNSAIHNVVQACLCIALHGNIIWYQTSKNVQITEGVNFGECLQKQYGKYGAEIWPKLTLPLLCGTDTDWSSGLLETSAWSR